MTKIMCQTESRGCGKVMTDAPRCVCVQRTWMRTGRGTSRRTRARRGSRGPAEKMTIGKLKDWLTEQGHEERVWALTQARAKKPAYVAAAREVLGA